MMLTQDIFLIKIITFSLTISFYVYIKQMPYRLFNFFEECVANTKISKFLSPMLRGSRKSGKIFRLIESLQIYIDHIRQILNWPLHIMLKKV